MYTFLVILTVLASLLLTLLVLVQNSKGGGLAAGFQSSNQIMGVRKTTDFLEKATWALVIAVVVFSVASVAFHPKENVKEGSEISGQLDNAAQQTPGVVTPGFDENADNSAEGGN